MNILTLITAQIATRGDIGMMPKIIFWLLLILWAIGALGGWTNEVVVRGTNIVLIVLFAILGYYLFGF